MLAAPFVRLVIMRAPRATDGSGSAPGDGEEGEEHGQAENGGLSLVGISGVDAGGHGTRELVRMSSTKSLASGAPTPVTYANAALQPQRRGSAVSSLHGSESYSNALLADPGGGDRGGSDDDSDSLNGNNLASRRLLQHQDSRQSLTDRMAGSQSAAYAAVRAARQVQREFSARRSLSKVMQPGAGGRAAGPTLAASLPTAAAVAASTAVHTEGVPREGVAEGAEVDRMYAELDALDAAREAPRRARAPSQGGSSDGWGGSDTGSMHNGSCAGFASQGVARKVHTWSNAGSTTSERNTAFFQEMARAKAEEEQRKLDSMDAAERQSHEAAKAELAAHERQKSHMLDKQMKTYAKGSSALILSGGSGRGGRGVRVRHRRSTSSL